MHATRLTVFIVGAMFAGVAAGYLVPRGWPNAAAGFTDVSLTYTASIVDGVGTVVTLDPSRYRVDRNQTPGGVRTLYGQTWPAHIMDRNAVTLTWWAGYGEDGTKVPKAVKPAILMLVAHLFRNREMTAEGALSEVPMGVKHLLNTVRWGGY